MCSWCLTSPSGPWEPRASVAQAWRSLAWSSFNVPWWWIFGGYSLGNCWVPGTGKEYRVMPTPRWEEGLLAPPFTASSKLRVTLALRGEWVTKNASLSHPCFFCCFPHIREGWVPVWVNIPAQGSCNCAWLTTDTMQSLRLSKRSIGRISWDIT